MGALLLNLVLYCGYGLYSLIAIGNTVSTLVDKMNIAIQIFFVLEIDDWSCLLFILLPGVLCDDDFDVKVVLHETHEDAEKRVQTRLWVTTLLLVISVVFVFILSEFFEGANGFN